MVTVYRPRPSSASIFIPSRLEDWGRDQDRGCGKYKVRKSCLILEATGEMREMENTVIREELNCTCKNVLGGCPRQDPVYWREIWLARVENAAGTREETAAVCVGANTQGPRGDL